MWGADAAVDPRSVRRTLESKEFANSFPDCSATLQGAVRPWQTGPSRWLLLWNQQLSEEFGRNRTRQALYTPITEIHEPSNGS